MRNHIKTSFYRKLPSIFLFLFAVVLTGCSSDDDLRSATEMYEEGKNAMAENNCMAAIRSFEVLDSRYPFSPYKDQVQLDMMFCYYKTNNIEMSLAMTDRFLRLNPTHKDLDYVLYIRGLTNSLAKEDAFQALFNVDRAERDIQYADSAFKDFKRLLLEYPDSQYVKDSQLRLISLKDYLARHHIAIAKYYYSRTAYIAAANRGQFILETYANTESIQDALEVMYFSYEKLKQPKLAEHAKTVYELNYGDMPDELN